MDFCLVDKQKLSAAYRFICMLKIRFTSKEEGIWFTGDDDWLSCPITQFWMEE